VVLDPDARRRDFRTERRRGFLEKLAGAAGKADAYVEAYLARDGAGQKSQLLVKSRFAPAEVSEAVARLAATGKAVVAGDVVADAAWWQRLRQSAADAIDAEHKAHPEQAGLRLADLRAALEKKSGTVAVFDALLADLCRADFVRAGDRVRRAGHRPALPPRLQSAGTRIRAALAAKPFDPPPRKEIAPDATAQQALRFLLETGEAVEVGPDVVMAVDAFAKAVAAVRKSLADEGPATVSELKQVLGVSRRIMVPFLEKLDRDGVTLRQGDVRVLRQPKGT
jgi:selenocysteine-specific elongation factor